MNNNYLKDQGLDKLINNDKTNNSNRIKPKYDDLIRLHKLILKRKPKIILEFGVGWSTIVIADAINKTKENSILYSVDASKEWLKRTKKLIPKKLKKFIIFHQSDVHIDIINGQIP